MGNRLNAGAPDKDFEIPFGEAAHGTTITLENLSVFTVTRGTAYFLLPSLASLRALAGIAG